MAPHPRRSETSKAPLQKPTNEHRPFMFDKGQVGIMESPSTGGTLDVRSLATKKSPHILLQKLACHILDNDHY